MNVNISELGKCVRAIRESANLSAEELAVKAGLQSGPTITRFETGRAQNPTFETIYKLVNYLSQLDIIKQKDFDFGGYSSDIVKLITAFSDETPREYRNSKNENINEHINYLERNAEIIDNTLLENFNFFIQSKSEYGVTYITLNNIDTAIKDKNVNINEIPYVDYICNILMENKERFMEHVKKVIEVKSLESIFEYFNATMYLLNMDILKNFESKSLSKNSQE